MFHELTGYPHDSNAVQSALRLQLRQARLAKKKPTWNQEGGFTFTLPFLLYLHSL